MKGLLSIVVSAALLGICVGEAYDEKQNAIRDISTRFRDAETLKGNILRAITNERGNINTSGETELLKYLESKVDDGKQELEKDASSVIRTAIVKAKPIGVIYCIRNVTYSGLKGIVGLNATTKVKVLNVRNAKYEKIDFDEYAVSSIMEGLEELISQAIEKITHTTGPIATLKKEAINNCDSASLLLSEIEVSVHEPILNREYVKMRQEVDRTFRELKISLNNALEKCVS